MISLKGSVSRPSRDTGSSATRPHPTGGERQPHPSGDPSEPIKDMRRRLCPATGIELRIPFRCKAEPARWNDVAVAASLSDVDTTLERSNPTATSARKRRPPGSMARAQSAASPSFQTDRTVRAEMRAHHAHPIRMPDSRKEQSRPKPLAPHSWSAVTPTHQAHPRRPSHPKLRVDVAPSCLGT